MFFMLVDPSQKSFQWVRAGHDPAILYDAFNDKFDELNGKGFVLGVNEKYSYQQYTYENWSEGQTILIGTDGIWETVNPEGEKFGKERIKEILRENNEFPALQIINTITEELSAFRKEAVQDDDITMVIIKSS